MLAYVLNYVLNYVHTSLFLTRADFYSQVAATRIQASFRGHQAHRQSREKRADEARRQHERRDSAARVIQARVRGHQVQIYPRFVIARLPAMHRQWACVIFMRK